MIERTRICHFTHLRNLAAIISLGRVLCKSQLVSAGTEYDDIAAQDIQRKRASKMVPCGPGGPLPDYVPFFFAARSPMLYFIWRHVDIYPEGQEPLVYLVSNAQAVQDTGLPFVFTDGHPIMRLTNYYDDLADLTNIDWEVMNSTWWNDTEELPDRQRRREAEFLVYDALPWELVTGLVVINDNMRRRVEHILEATDHKPPVRVVPGWYYP
jgi:hypothetical protein